MQLHRRQVAGVVVVLVPQSRRYGIAHDDADRVNGRSAELLVDGVSCFYEPFRSRERLRERSADGELQICLYVAGNIRFLVQDDDSNRLGLQKKHRDGHDQDGECDRQCDIAHGPGDRADHDVIANSIQPDPHPILEIPQRRDAPSFLVGQMGGQDEECLDERHQENEERDIGKHADDLVVGGCYEEEWEKSQNRRAHADGDRARHRPCAGYRGLQRALAPLALPRNALTDHHGIIHDDADHEEESEDCAHVQGEAGGSEEQQRADEGQGDANRDPGCDTKVEHEHQADENQ